ncbi:LO5 [Micropterus dolomieu adomavirus 2]|uniref:LO5 n=1 Tax=Micropterus dolomieu adomavirus 2 TaxID=2681676 RepID=A0A650BUF4_9VIRU|nr:LO5 [Micropterus dolomieu adomavirus 2]
MQNKQASGLGHPVFAIFDDDPLCSKCIITFPGEGVKSTRTFSGDGHLGLQVVSLTVSNTVLTIGGHLNNNCVRIDGNEYTLPELSCHNINTLIEALRDLQLPFTLMGTQRVKYDGASTLLVPTVYRNGALTSRISHTLAQMLGFTEPARVTFEGIEYLMIIPGTIGTHYPDPRGPTRDLILTCDDIDYCNNVKDVCGVVSPNGAFGDTFTKDLTEFIRPITVRGGNLKSLTFWIKDGSRRPVGFGHGPPSMFLRLLPLT